ncbi:unnamed protein product, partial [marine sediment metagenome]
HEYGIDEDLKKELDKIYELALKDRELENSFKSV